MKKKYYLIYTIVLLIFVGIFYLGETYFKPDTINNTEKRTTSNETSNTTTTSVLPNSNLTISYLDVGQADSILIKADNDYMLIDAGNIADGPKLVTYFKSLGITEFKYVVGTHPHEDHIGGLKDIVNNFKIATFYLPDAITTTAVYEDLLDALSNNNDKVTVPIIGNSFTLGNGTFTVLYTGTDTDNLNNSSIVLRYVYGTKSFLFMGDAPISIEKQIMTKDITSDVLKVGHHGSSYSSSLAFLQAVNPKYAIISVGKNNIYGLPTNKTLSNLASLNIKIYRTDQDGTIVCTSDGTTLNFTTITTDTNG
jgi:competence protein ComEC